MDENGIRIPKSFRYWFRIARIKEWRRYGLHRRNMSKYNYLDGFSRDPRFAAGTVDGRRVFRVLPHVNLMEICDGDFDRWANSVGASVPMPRTEAEFHSSIETLLRESAPVVEERKRIAEFHEASMELHDQ